jgi:hypothetical protein
MAAVGGVDWFKGTIAASALNAASAVGYYFVIYLPARDREALARQEKSEQIAAQAAAERERQEALTRQQNEINLARCLSGAEEAYSATWNSNCASRAQRNRSQYADCIAQGLLGKTYCHSLYGETATTNCSLPRDLANDIEASRVRDKAECHSQFQ